MSKLYGTLSGDGRAKEQTRCGHRVIQAAAQSWNGSLSVQVYINADGQEGFCIRTSHGSDAHPLHTIAQGTIFNQKLVFDAGSILGAGTVIDMVTGAALNEKEARDFRGVWAMR